MLLASTSTDAYAVAVYTGTGDGTFTTPVVTAAGNGDASDTQPDSIVAADFNGDGKTDIAFTTDNGLFDVMLATSGGSMGSATSLTLPSGHLAIGVTTVDYNDDGIADLIVEVNNTNIDGRRRGPFVSLDLFDRQRLGRLHRHVHLPDGRRSRITQRSAWSPATSRARAWASRSPSPSPTAAASTAIVDIVPLSSSGTWGGGVLHYVGSYCRLDQRLRPSGNIVAADLNGSGKPSIALVNSGTGQIEILLADPASNQFLPVEAIDASSTAAAIGMLAVAPFMGHRRDCGLPRPDQRPSTLVQNERRHVDPNLPRRHRHPVQLRRARKPRGRRQRQYVHTTPM